MATSRSFKIQVKMDDRWDLMILPEKLFTKKQIISLLMGEELQYVFIENSIPVSRAIVMVQHISFVKG